MTTPVLHGIDQVGLAAKRPTNAPNGFVFYDRTLDALMAYDEDLKTWFRVDGRPQYSVSSPGELIDHFRAPDLYSGYNLANGSDAQAVDPALIAGDPAGILRLTTGDDAAGTVAANGSAWAGPALAWEAEEGQITLRYRFKLSAITNLWLFAGLTDVLPGTTLEEPLSLSGTTYTANADDACGVMFDTAATTDTFRAVGVAGTTEATHVDTAIEPVAGTYNEIRIVLTTAGTMYVYIDGTLKATVASAVSVGVDLVPIVAAAARSTASRNLDLDLVSLVQAAA